MNALRIRSGYTFLLSVLFIGAITTAATMSVLLVAWVNLRYAQTIGHSEQAFAYALSCAEHALLTLHENLEYSGDEERTLEQGTCFVLPIGGTGNGNRTICTEGVSGNVVRRMEILIDHTLPSVSVISWQEPEFFTLCEY